MHNHHSSVTSEVKNQILYHLILTLMHSSLVLSLRSGCIRKRQEEKYYVQSNSLKSIMKQKLLNTNTENNHVRVVFLWSEDSDSCYIIYFVRRVPQQLDDSDGTHLGQKIVCSSALHIIAMLSQHYPAIASPGGAAAADSALPLPWEITNCWLACECTPTDDCDVLFPPPLKVLGQELQPRILMPQS